MCSNIVEDYPHKGIHALFRDHKGPRGILVILDQPDQLDLVDLRENLVKQECQVLKETKAQLEPQETQDFLVHLDLMGLLDQRGHLDPMEPL